MQMLFLSLPTQTMLWLVETCPYGPRFLTPASQLCAWHDTISKNAGT
jgi:uncharacterized cysteine cluster protein YcgN (CxxCxxCC family)